MRRTTLSPGALLLAGSLALAAGPAAADAGPQLLSPGDLQGIGIGTRAEPMAAQAPTVVVAPTPSAAVAIVRPQLRPARLIPAARPAPALSGPLTLDIDRLQAVTLTSVTRMTPVAIQPAAGVPVMEVVIEAAAGQPALVEPRAAPVAAAAFAPPLPLPRPAPVIATPAGQPLPLGAEALGSVGIGTKAVDVTGGAQP